MAVPNLLERHPNWVMLMIGPGGGLFGFVVGSVLGSLSVAAVGAAAYVGRLSEIIGLGMFCLGPPVGGAIAVFAAYRKARAARILAGVLLGAMTGWACFLSMGLLGS